MYEPTIAGEVNIRELINMALSIDAINTFRENIIGENKFATDYLDKYGIDDVEQVIKYTIKLIRFLNYAIVRHGSDYNKKNRSTYKFVENNLIKNAEDQGVYRLIGWTSTFEDPDIKVKLDSVQDPSTSYIEFKVPEGCFNAGKLREIGRLYILKNLI